MPARADLVPWQDYEISDSVYLVTTIRVRPNMGDKYLAGLKKTWIPRQDLAKKLGHIESYQIYQSDPFEGGGFNLLLVVKFSETADLAPSRERYREFMRRWGEEKQKETIDHERSKYPVIREILDQKYMREIKINQVSRP